MPVLALFVVIELEVDAPLLNVRVFRHWPFINSLLLVSALSIGLFAVLFYVPLLLQEARGLGAFDTGLILLPQALAMAVIMPSAGLLYDRIGARWPASIGLALVALGTYLLTDVNLESSTSHVIWVLVLRAVGMGLAMMPIMTGGLSAVPPDQVDRAARSTTSSSGPRSALGLVGLTSLVTYSREQFALDRGLLVSPGAPMPMLAPGPTGRWPACTRSPGRPRPWRWSRRCARCSLPPRSSPRSASRWAGTARPPAASAAAPRRSRGRRSCR